MAEEKMIQVPESKLQTLLERVTKLEKGSVTVRPKRVTTHTAFLRFVEDKPVVKLHEVYGVVNPDTKIETLFVKLTLLDPATKETEDVELPYLKFLNELGVATKSLIKSQEAHEVVEVEGYLNTSPTDPVHTKFFVPEQVPAEVRSVTYDVTVEVLEGKHQGLEITVPQSVLNI